MAGFYEIWKFSSALGVEMEIQGYRRGVELFNAGHFFDAHEVLEDVWRAAPEPEKLFLQGIIQVAVALHHHSTGNLVGACSLLERAARNLSGYPPQYGGMRVDKLLGDISQWRSALKEGTPLPPLPKIEVTGC